MLEDITRQHNDSNIMSITKTDHSTKRTWQHMSKLRTGDSKHQDFQMIQIIISSCDFASIIRQGLLPTAPTYLSDFASIIRQGLLPLLPPI
jgi:hypothetical protein